VIVHVVITAESCHLIQLLAVEMGRHRAPGIDFTVEVCELAPGVLQEESASKGKDSRRQVDEKHGGIKQNRGAE
jgi:hypothetical protein